MRPQSLKSPISAMSATQPVQPTQPPPRTRWWWLRILDKTLRDAWFYVAAASLVVNIIYTFRPQIIVQATSPITEQKPISTLFALTNNGAMTLYDVQIRCDVWDGDTFRGSFSRIPVTSTPSAPISGSIDIVELAPTDVATRDCGFASNGTVLENMHYESMRIDIIITYDWLWGYRPGSASHHFDTRVIEGKIVLVPDVENKSALKPAR
jgi:hypothetical protein